jgi:hypothetical protein
MDRWNLVGFFVDVLSDDRSSLHTVDAMINR